MPRLAGMVADTAMLTLVGHEQGEGLFKSPAIQVKQSYKAVENTGWCLSESQKAAKGT